MKRVFAVAAGLSGALCFQVWALSMTTIEMDIFSGRPNPVWTLTADEGAALARLVAHLPPAAAPAQVDLGYRGFVVSGDSATLGVAGDMRVFARTAEPPLRIATPSGEQNVEFAASPAGSP